MHNETPWITDTSHKYEWEGITIWSGDLVIAHVVADQHDNEKDNARRIVACVNACAGISTELLEEVIRIQHERDLK